MESSSQLQITQDRRGYTMTGEIPTSEGPIAIHTVGPTAQKMADSLEEMGAGTTATWNIGPRRVRE